MKKKSRNNPRQTIAVETVLNCKATAALQKEIVEELNEEDKPLKELLADDKTKDKE